MKDLQKLRRDHIRRCKEYDVKITETGSRGDGIARIQGFVIFVKNGKIGQDTVKVKVNSVGDRFATAETVVATDDTPSSTLE